MSFLHLTARKQSDIRTRHFLYIDKYRNTTNKLLPHFIHWRRDGKEGEGEGYGGRWGGGGGEREREIIYLSLHCHHQNDFSIKMGSDEGHFNVSLIARDKV